MEVAGCCEKNALQRCSRPKYSMELVQCGELQKIEKNMGSVARIRCRVGPGCYESRAVGFSAVMGMLGCT